MNFNDPEVMIGCIAVAAILYKFFTTTNKDEEGRIKDESVNLSNVLDCLDNFEVKMESRLKDGYTEKSIQNQLKSHLQEAFVHIIDEYGIEGVNGTKIDFDIGSGAVGLELKLAKSLFKTASLHRLIGQIDDYQNYKYDDDNLIVAVFGEKEHTKNNAMITHIKDKVEDLVIKSERLA